MKYIPNILAVVLLIASGQSLAAIISEGNVSTEYATGQFANLQGLEWLSLDETQNQSRISVTAGFGGFIADGWRYATRAETAILLGSLWDHVYDGYSLSNAPGAKWFIDNFGALNTGSNSSFTGISETGFFFGNLNECGDISRPYCQGDVRYAEVANSDRFGFSVLTLQSEFIGSANTGPYGAFYEVGGVDMGLTDFNQDISANNSSGVAGSLLVRTDSTVPPSVVSLPTTVWLFISGMIGLAGLYRQRGRQYSL